MTTGLSMFNVINGKLIKINTSYPCDIFGDTLIRRMVKKKIAVK